MPSAFTHAFSAIALSSAYRFTNDKKKIIITGAICSAFPDVDAIGFHNGVPYDSLFGHRGFTHSFFFAALLSIIVMISFFRNENKKQWWMLFSYFFISTSLHPILDACTSGGMGVAFFSPFSNERYFFPWRPILVSPISIERFFSGRGWEVFKSEFMYVWIPGIIWMICFYFINKFRKNKIEKI